MLNKLITTFHSLDLSPTADEWADVLWLALQMRRQLSTLSAKPLAEKLESLSEEKSSLELSPVSSKKIDPLEKRQTVVLKTDDSLPLYPRSAGKGTGDGLPFRTPAARLLPHTLSLARAFRPLMQRVASRVVYQLNEPATIDWIAETQIWMPVLQGVPERRFEIALVIENSGSMEIWPPVIAEFRKLLENHGAFRKVQTWELQYEEASQAVHLYATTHTTSTRSRSAKELLDSTHRRLIVVVSDCISSAWYTGEMTQLLETWGHHHPVAILQMLPQRLWRGTGLTQALRVNLRTPVANVANWQLEDDAAEAWLADNIPKGIKMPIVTLEAESLNNWAKLVMGKGENWVQGVIFLASNTVPPKPAVTETTSAPPLTATQRVKRFNALASPLAQQLAGYLAAAPLTLEVMRLVQQVMLPESGQIHLAEVFLGGLLKREEVDWVKYDFHEGVREILLDSQSVPEGIEVLKVVSAFIERRLGCALDFGAWLGNPARVGVELDEGSRPFAKVAGEVLRRLGGEYEELAEKIEWIDKKGFKMAERFLAEIEQAAEEQWQALDLSGKGLTGLPSNIGKLSKLQQLNLRENRLTKLPTEIGNLGNLEELDLDFNALKELPREIGNLRHLKHLCVARNYSLQTIPDEVFELKNLERLRLGANKISELSHSIGRLGRLTHLSIWGNPLNFVPMEIFTMKQLRILNLSQLHLRSLPKEIGNLTHLKVIGLEGNQLTHLPDEIANLKELEELYLEDNFLPIPREILAKIYEPTTIINYYLQQQATVTKEPLNKDYLLLTEQNGQQQFEKKPQRKRWWRKFFSVFSRGD